MQNVFKIIHLHAFVYDALHHIGLKRNRKYVIKLYVFKLRSLIVNTSCNADKTNQFVSNTIRAYSLSLGCERL